MSNATPPTPADRARLFHTLHAGPAVLRLPNAWDAGSARLVAALGAPAIATSSAAVAWAQGYADGDQLPRGPLLAVIEAIAAATPLPLSVDFESGYSDDPSAVAALASELIARGVVGINIEDGSAPPALLADKIAAIRAVAAAADVDLFINARTDVWLRGLVPAAQRVDETLRRAALYRAAGASGLFPAGISAPDEIAAVVSGAGLPVNVLDRPTLPDAVALQRLGVRRHSAGSALFEQLFGTLAAMTRGFLADGRLPAAGPAPMGYGEINAVMKRGG
jgi:2-methylisocitrate lyase-like PEP mutase family enzyme